MDEDLQRKIRARAFQLWEAGGRSEGDEWSHWLEAERQVMAEEGLGEPAGAQPELPPSDRPEPQPEIPADPLRNPEQIHPITDPEYPATPGPQEMPANPTPQPEMPAEPGIAEIPAPSPGTPAAVAKRNRGGKTAGLAPSGSAAVAVDAGRKRGRTGKGKDDGAAV